ncbi:MAG: thioredoxin family protein [Ignavibacteria bacterium]|nr:thioredoxin family protein [Ignavibacteria bacterium]
MVLLKSNHGELGSAVIDFSLKGVDDNYYSLSGFEGKKIIVIIFMCNHCPYVKGVISRLVKLQNDFSPHGIQLIGINSNDTNAYPEDSFENMKVFYKEHKMNFPYLFDETQQTARNYDAVCTPDIYVYDADRVLRYRGRMDDNWQDESSVKSKDLENAINALLKGQDIIFKQVPSMGCSIKWKN